MESHPVIKASFCKLLNYMEHQQFKGYDPYDGLQSPIWKLPILKNSIKLQFFVQQAVKRSPINLRPLLMIRKGLNPVTLGLTLQSYTAIYQLTKEEEILTKARQLLLQLEALQSTGYSGMCWGYEFRWASRYALIPSRQPTVVATGIIVNALYKFWKVTRDNKAAGMILSAARFVEMDLHRTIAKDDSFCFSYSPFDQEQVYNASMKGARLLAQANAVTTTTQYTELVSKACTWIASRQNSDGSWKYSESKSGVRTDNYHTGYILDCLADCIQLCGLSEFQPVLNKGETYYRNNFFEADGQPKFYNNEIWPADCTSGGQSILTLLRMQDKQAALTTAFWMIKNMQDEEGYYYFRKYKNYFEKSSFMRWSNAWMLAALGELLFTLNDGGRHA